MDNKTFLLIGVLSFPATTYLLTDFLASRSSDRNCACAFPDNISEDIYVQHDVDGWARSEGTL